MDKSIFAPNPISVDIEPLTQAIANGNAVVFVGAGASQASGLPSWEALLTKCLDRAIKHSRNPSEWAKTKASLDEKNFLMVAELLHKGLGPQKLGLYLASAIGGQAQPSRIHKAIARIPFSLAVTTNYDNLLEYVVHPPPEAVFTWQETIGIFTAISRSKEKFLNNLTSSRDITQSHFGRPRPSFPIIKSHDDLEKPDTIVLTRSQYRDLAYQNKAFNECMKALLTYRTVLFVGCSITDPDTLALMDEIRMVHGTSSPHYAIVSDSMVDSHYEQFLRESFNIYTIRYNASIFRSPEERIQLAVDSGESRESAGKNFGEETPEWSRKRRSSKDIQDEDPRTTAVFEILKEISGKSSKKIQERSNVLKFGSPVFSRNDACNILIAHACEVTGSDYGDICLIVSPNSRKLEQISSYPTLTGDVNPEWRKVPHNSIIGALFVQRKVSGDYIYIPNVARAREHLQQYRGAFETPEMLTDYKPCHPDVKSEIACPILADGECVGIINLESTVEDAYTRDHLEVIRNIALEVGAAHVAAARRSIASRGLNPCLFPKGFKGEFTNENHDCTDLDNLLRVDQVLERENLAFIIWERDSIRGTLHPNFPISYFTDDQSTPPGRIDEIRSFSYRFGDRSLVGLCHRERRRIFIPDAAAEIAKKEGSLLNREGVRLFKISGPVVACPIRSRGHLAAVLVCWSRNLRDAKPSASNSFRYRQVSQATERTHRILDILSNIPKKSITGEEFPRENVYNYIEEITAFRPKRGDSANEVADSFLKLAVSTKHLPLVFGRIRLWLTSRRVPGSIGASCVSSAEGQMPGYSFTTPDGRPIVGSFTDQSDPYLSYTYRRASGDPYARLQHPDLFNGLIDPNWKVIGKDKLGSWIVGPIVRVNAKVVTDGTDLHYSDSFDEVLGFISVDSHLCNSYELFVDQIKFGEHEQLLRFQRRIVDLLTSILSDFLVDVPNLRSALITNAGADVATLTYSR